jgi:mono/diheme cytochrome c family protein
LETVGLVNKVSIIAWTVALLGAITTIGVTGQSPTARSVLSGIYSEEQAVHGQALYYQHCLQCHGEMMNGVDQAPPLAGPQFSGIWSGETLWSLVERIGTMPPDKPGTLTDQESVNILVYMLWFNGFPIGKTSLATDKNVLTEINFGTSPVDN